MTWFVKTSVGTYLMRPTVLTVAVRQIELHLPGWWWSISQKVNVVRLSAGPGRNCPNPKDRAYSETRQGDRGSIFDIDVSKHPIYLGDEVKSWIDRVLKLRDDHMIDMAAITVDTEQSSFRQQADDDIRELEEKYGRFLEEIPRLEARGHWIEQVYLGSCDLSVDCSLRGYYPSKKPFDISIDLTPIECNLSEALSMSIVDFKTDVLTAKDEEAEP